MFFYLETIMTEQFLHTRTRNYMLEDAGDRLGGTFQPLFGSKLYKWECLIFSLGLMDLWHVSSFECMQDSLAYSRSDRKQSHTICLG